MKLWRRVAYILIGFFESLTLTGIIFGWPSLLHVLQLEGIYSHLCIEGNADSVQNGNISTSLEQQPALIKCSAQDNMFGLMYSIMMATFGIPSFAIGYSLDLLGLRYTRIFASSLLTTGFVFVSIATALVPWPLWPGMLMISLGSCALRLCTVQSANAWPEKKATIVFAFTSAHALATIVFLMFQYANAFGIPLRASALCLSTISGLSFISTFILPKMRVEDDSILSNDLQNTPEKDIDLSALDGTETIDNKEDSSKSTTPLFIPIMQSINTMSFAFHMMWLLNILMLRFHTTSFNTWAWKTTNDPNQVAYYNSIAGICSLISPFISPLGGPLTDFLMKKSDKKSDPIDRLVSNFQAPTTILAITSILTLGVYICKLFYSQTAVYISILLVSVARPVSVASLLTYVRIRFYPQHFNRLTGIGITIISIIGLIHYPMYLWLFYSDESYTWASLVYCVVVLLTFVSPGHLMISSLQRKFAVEQIQSGKII